MGKNKKNRRKKDRKGGPFVADRHYLYSSAVQSVEADIKFFRRAYKKKRGRPFRRLREDFCGTALLACDWVRRGKDHEAWGVDLDRATLEWGRQHWVPRLGKRVRRLHLENRNVLEVAPPRVDMVVAQNFSYSVFKTRELLGRYFRGVRRSLQPEGMFILDAWGGTEAMCEDVEKRRIPAETAFDGTRVPGFTYIWDQARFNPIDHHILCHIHFKLPGGRKLKKAFTYDWRLWTLPELRELLLDAGFESVDVFVEGWDEEEDDTDGVFRRKKYFENQDGWVAYVVAHC